MRVATRFGLRAVTAVGIAALSLVVLAAAAEAKAKARPPVRPPQLATYVGIWGENAAQCRRGISPAGPNSAVRFAAKAYDQWEQHCNLSSIRAVGATWTMTARCVGIDAPAFTDKAVIWTTATRLTVKWQSERANLNYIRCR